MRCHYDLLAVPKESNDDEIKKAYRKLALQWHPDKNPDNIEECTKHFQLIQQAYDVLSDPQERAWYDKHREAILKGGLGHGDEYEDKSLDVYQYFNSSCYCGFGDDEKGFYAVYGEVFKKISLEDQEYMDGVNTAPEFGNSQNTYEDSVGNFYAYWESYSTAKSFVWVEKYDTREAPNRQIRRLMEQDNKKLRDKARRERNEEVRALVAYVRKRDRRVQAYKVKLEERAIEITKRAEEKRKKDRQERLKKLENYKESSWSSMSELERELKQLEMNVAQQFGDVDSDDYISEEEAGATAGTTDETVDDKVLEDDDIAEYYDSLYCIACKKSFKSHKALDNHNGSKKHIENIYLLQLEMADDDKFVETQQEEDINDSEEEDTLQLNNSRSKSKKQRKKRRQQLKVQAVNETDEEGNGNESEDGTGCDETAGTVLSNGIEQRLHTSLSTELDASVTANCEVLNGESSNSVKEDLKSQKKQKSKKSTNSVEASNVTQSSPAGNCQQTSVVCNKCHQVFSTRNKLFDHIKVTGHALHIDSLSTTTTDVTTNASKSKNKKGKRK